MWCLLAEVAPVALVVSGLAEDQAARVLEEAQAADEEVAEVVSLARRLPFMIVTRRPFLHRQRATPPLRSRFTQAMK
jgi:hypothetical protein